MRSIQSSDSCAGKCPQYIKDLLDEFDWLRDQGIVIDAPLNSAPAKHSAELTDYYQLQEKCAALFQEDLQEINELSESEIRDINVRA